MIIKFVLRHQGSGTLTIESGKIKSTNNQYCTEGIRNTGSGTINIGIKEYKNKSKKIRSFESNILSGYNGSKGIKK